MRPAVTYPRSVACTNSRQGPYGSQDHLNIPRLNELHEQSHSVVLEDSLAAGIISRQDNQVVSCLKYTNHKELQLDKP